MNVQISRTSFFKGFDCPHLAFPEHYPPVLEKSRQLCNCTKIVTERPSGVPQSESQGIEFSVENDKRRFEFRLPGHISFWWEDKDLERPHAYFWFNEKLDKMHVEVAAKGVGLVDCLLGRVFFGNEVDTSMLMNGHAPSRIINLAEIDPGAVWAHDCSWGTEAIEIFQEETGFWQQIREDVSKVAHAHDVFFKDTGLPLKELYDVAQGDVGLNQAIKTIYTELNGFMDRWQHSELFRCCNQVGEVWRKKANA